MHEFHVAQDLVRKAVEEALGRGASRLKGLFVRLGSLEHLNAEDLAFSLMLALQGTIGEGARLHINTVTGERGVVLEAIEVEE